MNENEHLEYPEENPEQPEPYGPSEYHPWDETMVFPAATDPVPPTQPRRSLWRRPLAVGLALAIAAGGGAGITYAATSHGSSTPSTRITVAPALNASGTTNVKSALATIEPAVVDINTDTSTAFGTGQGEGTGIIITSGGEVLTNNHVISGATSITVNIPGHSGSVNAHVIGADPSHDLALIQLSGVSGLPTATFADSSNVQVGDQVLAVGNALGLGGSPTVTEGIISALNRNLNENGTSLSGLIQTDAAINPGNSGGPLVDLAGHVVGIDTAILTGSRNEPAEGIGLAIPSNTALSELSLLRNGGTTGGSSNNNTNSSAGYLGVDVVDAAGGGAQIAAVAPGSPAESSGLQAGDIITAIDGNSVSGADALASAISSHKAGSKVTLTVTTASGQNQQITATLTSRPSQ
jgi:putative serine protease PepD